MAFGAAIGAATLLALLLSAIGPRSAFAQDASCRAAAKRVGNTIILPAWCTVAVEHADRRARLDRLARLQGMAETPRFYEYVVARDDLKTLLPAFPADIPVLRVVFGEQVFFDFDKATVRPEAAQVLDLISESLRREPPDVALFVAGHTDAIGSDAYNTDLAMRRADAVAHALLDRGIGLSSIFRVSFGKTMPIDTNATDLGRQHNRRVEFLFAAKSEAAAVWLAKQAAATCYRGDSAAYDRCANAISIAVEIKRDSVRLLSPDKSTRLEERPDRHGADLGTRGAAARLNAQSAEAQIAQGRTYTIDLGKRTVTIGLPRR